MGITNSERVWFMVFVMWCKKYGKDYTKESFDQIKTFPDEEYGELLDQALHAILCSGKCPSCWEAFDDAPALCKGTSTIPTEVVCPHCQQKYSVVQRLRTAECVIEE